MKCQFLKYQLFGCLCADWPRFLWAFDWQLLVLLSVTRCRPARHSAKSTLWPRRLTRTVRKGAWPWMESSSMKTPTWPPPPCNSYSMSVCAGVCPQLCNCQPLFCLSASRTSPTRRSWESWCPTESKWSWWCHVEGKVKYCPYNSRSMCLCVMIGSGLTCACVCVSSETCQWSCLSSWCIQNLWNHLHPAPSQVTSQSNVQLAEGAEKRPQTVWHLPEPHLQLSYWFQWKITCVRVCVCVTAVPEMDPPIDTNLIEFDTKWVFKDQFYFYFL